MTKIELVKIVAQKTGIDQATVLAAVEGMVDTIEHSEGIHYLKILGRE